MAQSLATIALQFTQPPGNKAPVFIGPAVMELTQGVAATGLLSAFWNDPEGDPLQIDVSGVSASLSGMGFVLNDLGADVQWSYDGRNVGAVDGTPVEVLDAFVCSADDGQSPPRGAPISK